jgi:16S rRNA (adenine1518-N6/adenine1519-N6)-dimethyltransferase
LSVLLQSYYETENLFTVQPGAFVPPPKVKSAVIRLKKKKEMPSVELQKWKMLIKTAFNQRRKQLSNSLVKLLQGKKLPEIFANQRPEQLSIKEFIQIYQYIYGES